MVVLVNSRFIPELGWRLIVEQDEGEALTPLRQVLFINFAISAALYQAKDRGRNRVQAAPVPAPCA